MLTGTWTYPEVDAPATPAGKFFKIFAFVYLQHSFYFYNSTHLFFSGFKNHGRSSPAVSMENTPKGDITFRKVAVLVADGYDEKQVAAVSAALKTRGASAFLVAPRGSVKNSSGGKFLCVRVANVY